MPGKPSRNKRREAIELKKKSPHIVNVEDTQGGKHPVEIVGGSEAVQERSVTRVGGRNLSQTEILDKHRDTQFPREHRQ